MLMLGYHVSFLRDTVSPFVAASIFGAHGPAKIEKYDRLDVVMLEWIRGHQRPLVDHSRAARH